MNYHREIIYFLWRNFQLYFGVFLDYHKQVKKMKSVELKDTSVENLKEREKN